MPVLGAMKPIRNSCAATGALNEAPASSTAPETAASPDVHLPQLMWSPPFYDSFIISSRRVADLAA
jgi:hypothetical protein